MEFGSRLGRFVLGQQASRQNEPGRHLVSGVVTIDKLLHSRPRMDLGVEPFASLNQETCCN